MICLILTSSFAFGQIAQSEISTEEKVYGISKVWSEVNSNFANFDVSKVDWDGTYKNYITRILETKTTEEYYFELIKMVALLKDGHTNVYYPFKNQGRIPLRTKLIENKVIITSIFNDSLRNLNIEVGDQIIEINKINAVDYGRTNIMPFQSSSTIQDLNIRTYTYALFYGNADEKVELKIKKKNNLVFTTTLSRGLTYNRKYITYDLQITKDNIAYLKVNDFENSHYKEIFDSLYVQIQPTKALIIDMRENGGGNGDQGFYILSHLIAKSTLAAKSKTKQNIASFKAWGNTDMWLETDPYSIEPIYGKERYMKPVIVLTGAQTFSAGEDFLVAFDNSNRGIKIGQTTGGSTGQPLFFDLPRGGKFRVCTKRDIYPSGKEFVGIGIIPEIEVKETVKSIQDKQDIVLEKAIEVINKK